MLPRPFQKGIIATMTIVVNCIDWTSGFLPPCRRNDSTVPPCRLNVHLSLERDLQARLSLYRERVEHDGNPVKIERVEISSHIFASFVGNWVFYLCSRFSENANRFHWAICRDLWQIIQSRFMREMFERYLGKNKNSNLGDVIQIFLTIL